MQGLANLAVAFADAIAVVLPALCYGAACACFLRAVWALRRWSREPDLAAMRPWVPWVNLLFCGFFASFPQVLTMLSISAAGSGAAAVALGSYAPTAAPDAGGVLGGSAGQAVINIIGLFKYFFQAFGALCVFRAFLMLREAQEGEGRARASPAAVRLVFGVLCLNIVTVAGWIVTLAGGSP